MTFFNDTPLLFASQNGHNEILQLLLSQPSIEINYKDIWKSKNSLDFNLIISSYCNIKSFMELNSNI